MNPSFSYPLKLFSTFLLFLNFISMVFHSVSETETPPLSLPPSKPSMPSAAPSPNPKPQPLHNFPLSNLSWSMNHSTNPQHLRRMPDPTHLETRPVSPLDDDHSRGSPELLRPSSPFPVRSDQREVLLPNPTENSSGSVGDGGKSGFSLSAAVAEALMGEKEEKQFAATKSIEKKIPVPAKNKDGSDSASDDEEDESHSDSDDEDDEPVEMVKTWNLRPRRAVPKTPNPNANGGAGAGAGASKNGGVPVQGNKALMLNQPAMAPALAWAALQEKGLLKRERLSVSLSKEEIERDFLKMTGSRPPKKSKKRAKNVQKHMDGMFPGLWITTVTPQMYGVPDPPLKA